MVLKYRPEIDGLRALAVLPVILFHAGFEWFSGGFIGVDVFFVISGYLITTILLEDIEADRFSVLDFYERRARRILPALFFMLAACIPFAWKLMLPGQLVDFSQSLIAVSLFASNIYFWRESGYFDSETEEAPLLHTWSLAVEEQYYLLFPIFLMLAWRFGKRKVFWSLILLTLLSLLISEWGWRHKPTANFYLSPTRAWELLIGSLSAFILRNSGMKKNGGLAFLGLAAIAYATFNFDKFTPFPSVYTLVPVFGTMLLILYAHEETLTGRLLSTRVLVGVGLISYSAYLWHQPLFAFARIGVVGNPTASFLSILSLLSLVIAFFSWKYVEAPFREKKIIDRKSILVFSLGGLLLFCSLGLLGHINNGWPDRFSQSAQKFLVQINSGNAGYTTRRFDSLRELPWDEGKLKVFLIGDSYAQDIANAVYESTLSDKVSLSTWHIPARCGNLYVPFEEKRDLLELKYRKECQSKDIFERSDFDVRLDAADEVWLASSWQPWQVELIVPSLENYLQRTSGVVRFFGRKDFPHFDLHKYLDLTSEQRAKNSEPLSGEVIAFNAELGGLAKNYNFIDVQKLACGGDVTACKVFDASGDLKTYDGGHLTRFGAEFLGDQLSREIDLR